MTLGGLEKDFVEALQHTEPEDVILLGVHIGMSPAHVVGGKLRAIFEDIGYASSGKIALMLFGLDRESYKSAKAKAWAKVFVEGYADVLHAFADEDVLRDGGMDLGDFPGLGLLRMLVLAGHGETRVCDCEGCCCSAPIAVLDQYGEAMAGAIRNTGGSC